MLPVDEPPPEDAGRAAARLGPGPGCGCACGSLATSGLCGPLLSAASLFGNLLFDQSRRPRAHASDNRRSASLAQSTLFLSLAFPHPCILVDLTRSLARSFFIIFIAHLFPPAGWTPRFTEAYADKPQELTAANAHGAHGAHTTDSPSSAHDRHTLQTPDAQEPSRPAPPHPPPANRHPVAGPRPIQLWWFAPFYTLCGYGSEAREFVLSLAPDGQPVRSNLRIAISQHGDEPSLDFAGDLREITFAGLERLRLTRLQPDRAIVVCHSEPGAWNPPRFPTSLCPPEEEPAFTIGRTMFETNNVPSEWVERMRLMDEIWVPTTFNYETFRRSGVPASKMRIVPEAVDTEFYNPDTVPAAMALQLPLGQSLFPDAVPSASAGCAQQPFVFLSIFKFEDRKGWPILLEAFLRAFAGRCDVLLQILTNRFHMDADVVKLARQAARRAIRRAGQSSDGEQPLTAQLAEENPATGHQPGESTRHSSAAQWTDSTANQQIYIMDGQIADRDMPRLYRAADAFVLPSHGEGFGRPHVEAMAMGLPVIATNWSGITAYLTEDNGYPLRITGLVKVPRGAYRHHHSWALPDIDHLVELFRHVESHRQEAAEKGRQARRHMVEKFSRPVIAQMVLNELDRIQKRLDEEDDADEGDD